MKKIPKRQIFPMGAVRDFERIVFSFLDANLFGTEYVRIATRIEAQRFDVKKPTPGEINSITKKAQKIWLKKVKKLKLLKPLERTWKVNKDTFYVNFKKFKPVSVDPITDTPKISKAINAASKISIAKIKSIGIEHHEAIRAQLLKSHLGGPRVELEKFILERVDVTKSKAKFIARDQISKLNGELSRIQQTQNGIHSYSWSTSLDGRVRDTHAEKNGVEFRWDSPPEDTGHPGEDYQCRCIPEPIF